MRRWAADGRTVLSPAHYLEEADAFSEPGRGPAPGTGGGRRVTTEVKGPRGNRSIRCTLIGLAEGDAGVLGRLAGVTGITVHGNTVSLCLQRQRRPPCGLL